MICTRTHGKGGDSRDFQPQFVCSQIPHSPRKTRMPLGYKLWSPQLSSRECGLYFPKVKSQQTYRVRQKEQEEEWQTARQKGCLKHLLFRVICISTRSKKKKQNKTKLWNRMMFILDFLYKVHLTFLRIKTLTDLPFHILFLEACWF